MLVDAEKNMHEGAYDNTYDNTYENTYDNAYENAYEKIHAEIQQQTMRKEWFKVYVQISCKFHARGFQISYTFHAPVFTQLLGAFT